jgi:hypothetical protein
LTAKQRKMGFVDGLAKTKGIVEPEEINNEVNPHWLKRTPDTWLNYKDNSQLNGEVTSNEKRIIQKEDLERREQLLQKKRDTIQKQIEQEKQAQDEWTAMQQVQFNETDGALSQFTMQMRQNFLDKQKEIETLSNQRREERKQAEREEAERREAEKKAQQEVLALEQKVLLEQNKKGRAPSKSPEKKKR